jgi:uncharacterized OB-fold protein
MTANPAVAADVTDPVTAPFWAGTRAGELLAQRCANCAHLRWPPGPVCPSCLSADAEWARLDPTGTLISYCVYRRSFDKAFADAIPYAVGYIQLADGPRMYGQLTGPLDELAVDAPVRAVFAAVTDEVTLIQWTTARSEGDPA